MKHTLLIIDDNDAILQVLKKLFEKKYQVFTASDGVEAITILARGIMPHLIISDLNMHNINGYELIGHLSTSKMYNKIPVIILSGSYQLDPTFLKDQLVVAQVLNKPFDPILLLNIVEEIIFKNEYYPNSEKGRYKILRKMTKYLQTLNFFI
ncbi:MAG: response regulator [Chitinophagaceae bacterium]